MATQSLNGVERLQESAYNALTGRLKLRIIQSGFNKGRGRFYPPEVLARDHGVFEGAKMFADHQTDAEVKARPEGSVHNWVGQITNVHWDPSSKSVVGEAAVIDPPFKAKLEELSRQGLLPQMGISIRASGEASKAMVEGVSTNLVESLISARSVDFVTYPGAGGQVEAIESETLAESSARDLAAAYKRLGITDEEIESLVDASPNKSPLFLAAKRWGMTDEEAKTFAGEK